MADLYRVRLSEALVEVERELRQRARLYAEWVASKRMSRLTAERQLRAMEAVHAFLTELRDIKGGDHEVGE